MKKFLGFLVIIFALQSCNNPCKDVNCQNGGVCSEGACNCPDGFSGSFCQFDDALCENVNCLNGAICQNGLCDCPEGYDGVLCENELPIQKITINKVVVHSFPENNGQNTWDGADLNPDLRLIILLAGNEVLNSNQLINNAQADFSHSFISDFPFTIDKDDFLSNYTFKIEDEDGAQDELVANVFFTPNAFIFNRPSTISLSQGGVELELFVNYTY